MENFRIVQKSICLKKSALEFSDILIYFDVLYIPVYPLTMLYFGDLLRKISVNDDNINENVSLTEFCIKQYWSQIEGHF